MRPSHAQTFRASLKGLGNLLTANGTGGPLAVGLYQIDFGIARERYDPEFLALAHRCHEWIAVNPVEHDGSEGASPHNFDRACFWAGHALCIDSFGEVSVCVLSNRSSGSLGHIEHDSVFEVIARTTEWRSVLEESGRAARAQCAQCKKMNGGPSPAARATAASVE